MYTFPQIVRLIIKDIEQGQPKSQEQVENYLENLRYSVLDEIETQEDLTHAPNLRQ